MHPIAGSIAFIGLVHAQAQPIPTTSVQIVNATCVPALTLKINDRIAYNSFPQGKRTGDAPISSLELTYEAEDTRTGLRVKSAKVTYGANAYQSLIMLGDFSTDIPPDELRQPGQAPQRGEKQYSPNVIFQVFSHEAAKAPIRLRVINGMPGKSLIFAAGSKEMRIKPGAHAVLEGQTATAEYVARVDDEEIPLLMRQEGLLRNAIIVFFLKSGKPDFVRVFENNGESARRRAELEKNRE
ncbi:MAG TPA: hypothetical protein VIT23_10525 [Terrimicrobiaceae bacterium]